MANRSYHNSKGRFDRKIRRLNVIGQEVKLTAVKEKTFKKSRALSSAEKTNTNTHSDESKEVDLADPTLYCAFLIYISEKVARLEAVSAKTL